MAGAFYPRDPAALRLQLAHLLVPGRSRGPAIALISPHAGYEYSGAVAGAVFSSADLPDTFIIMAPSHRPIRPIFAVMTEGVWETPLGDVPIAADLAQALVRRLPLVRIDPSAHEMEHSLEVQLPFLQALRPAPAIVPVAVSIQARVEDLLELGRVAAAAIRECGRDVLLIASTDMSHYVGAEEARRKDFLAIQKILELDPRGLVEIVRSESISMCGFQPAAAVLAAALELGARKADLIMYAHSGERTGEEREVVGYAGLRIA
ncbi:MAG: AmmeMemoRadiSam system protein B [Candidatus Aminicenantes bacterium]|nr:AmmeMemoRadiSam system protein B [Candidatus Aminicenantes bacterium]